MIGDWLSLLHPNKLPRGQTSELNTSSTLDTTPSFLRLDPVLHYYQRFGYFALIKWHLLVVVRWPISAPGVGYHVWWGQTDSSGLKVGSCSRLGWTGLLHLYSERLTVGMTKRQVEGWAMRERLRLRRGIRSLVQTDILLTHISEGHGGQEKAEEWDGRVGQVLITFSPSLSLHSDPRRDKGQGGRFIVKTCFPKRRHPRYSEGLTVRLPSTVWHVKKQKMSAREKHKETNNRTHIQCLKQAKRHNICMFVYPQRFQDI